MFDAVNLTELGRVVQTIVAPTAAADGRVPAPDADTKRRLRHALFGPRGSAAAVADATPADQRDLLSQFTERVAGPLVEALPADVAPWAVLVVYQEFVDAAFIQPMWDGDLGGAG